MPLFRVAIMTLWLAALLVGGRAFAQLGDTHHIAVGLAAESDRPAAGSKVTLAMTMRPEPGWHGYWQNPGDAGAPIALDWRLPDGVTAGALRYPVPERLLIQGLMNYVFEGDHANLVDLAIPAGLPRGTRLPISASAQYLACTDRICVPEKAELKLDLIVGDGAIAAERRSAFDRYRQALPRPLGSQAHYGLTGGRLRLAIPFPAGQPVVDPYFYPADDGVLRYAAPQSVSRSGDMLIVETDAVDGRPRAVRGVLKIGEGLGLEIAAVPGSVPPAGEPVAGTPGSKSGAGLLAVSLLGAMLGGLLLNIMPCVFPILSLKALSLARAGESEAGARREALAYCAGVMLTCVALGAALLAIRAGGSAAGWAFQLQDPRVIFFLLLLVSAITLNLAGLYELPTLGGGQALAGRSGIGGAFWTGALAAFVATPCTGPFMGAALGAALVLPPASALAVFAGLGFGLALPFLLVGFVPALRRRLPRPGPWMVRFRHSLAVPMGLTALALAWILYRQAGAGGLLLGLAALMILAAALGWAGRSRGWLAVGPAIAACLGAAVLLPAVVPAAEVQAGSRLGATAFSEARLAKLRAEGRPVFLYFTADWCLTCKVNEKAVLDRDEVARAFKAHEVAVLVGDWTRGDPAISRFLEAHGRSGVPLYLYYPAGKPAVVLPQLLSAGTVTDILRR